MKEDRELGESRVDHGEVRTPVTVQITDGDPRESPARRFAIVRITSLEDLVGFREDQTRVLLEVDGDRLVIRDEKVHESVAVHVSHRGDRPGETVEDRCGTGTRRQRAGAKPYYISRTEISNRLFRNRTFFAGGRYTNKTLKHLRPKFWGADGTPPRHYSEVEQRWADGDDFPVVGVAPESANKFARVVFGGRLPRFTEWLEAARLAGDSQGRYPWQEAMAGKQICNTALRDWSATASPFTEHLWSWLQPPGVKRKRCWLTKVDFNPLERASPALQSQLAIDAERFLIHIIGNAGEFVTDGKGWVIAGGDFNTAYDQIDIDRARKYEDRDIFTGFRIVIDLDESPDPKFVARAEKE